MSPTTAGERYRISALRTRCEAHTPAGSKSYADIKTVEKEFNVGRIDYIVGYGCRFSF